MALKFFEVEGDLFSCNDSASLAHCVSQDLAMGAGIALEFRNRFGHVEELRKQGATIGQFAVLKHNERYIYYLVTKEKYNEKPKEIYLKYCLREMRDHIMENGITELCMPRVGCGLDELDWRKVKKLIQDVFKDCPIHLTVYSKEDSSSRQSLCYIEKFCDLFQSPENVSLAHCISEDLIMTKGIASEFKKKFGRESELKSQNAKGGQIAVLQDKERFIYYLIAKKNVRDNLSEPLLKQSLSAMKNHCCKHGVTQLAMPKIGLGLNKMPWEKVSEIIHDVFKQTDILLTVCSME